MHAQQLPPALPARQLPAPRTPGSELTISLLTMGPGEDLWEKFGHTALMIRDDAQGSEIAYNWGLFDMSQPDFLSRFIQGRPRYWMAGFQARAMIESYAASNRTVYVQQLRLTPAQRLTIRDYVQQNAEESNKYYQYDYYRDNCSTRVRDLLDRALGGDIRRATSTISTTFTYRSRTAAITQYNLPVYAGIQLIVGQPGDRPLSVWEDMFLPERLMAGLRGVFVDDSAGGQVRLVASEDTLFRGTRPAIPDFPPWRVPYFALVGLALAAMILIAGREAGRGRLHAREPLALGVLVWSILSGVLGLLLLLAWTATQHVVMASNENVLQVNPVSLLVAVTLAAGMIRDRRISPIAIRLSDMVAALALIGAVIQALPFFQQVNGEIIALFLPVHLAVSGALRLARHSPLSHARV